MICPHCQSENPEASRFCADCGTRLAKVGEEIPVEHTRTLETPSRELSTGTIFAERYQLVAEARDGLFISSDFGIYKFESDLLVDLFIEHTVDTAHATTP